MFTGINCPESHADLDLGNPQCPQEGQRSDRVKTAIRGFACGTQTICKIIAQWHGGMLCKHFSC